MSFFLTYAADSEEYLLKPAGYGLLIILLAALLFVCLLYTSDAADE